jgi:hypothetical protein
MKLRSCLLCKNPVLIPPYELQQFCKQQARVCLDAGVVHTKRILPSDSDFLRTLTYFGPTAGSETDILQSRVEHYPPIAVATPVVTIDLSDESIPLSEIVAVDRALPEPSTSYVVEGIEGCRLLGGQNQYLIRWHGFAKREWVVVTATLSCAQRIAEYWRSAAGQRRWTGMALLAGSREQFRYDDWTLQVKRNHRFQRSLKKDVRTSTPLKTLFFITCSP